MKIAELDAAHQRDVEKLATTSMAAEVKRGQIFGLIIEVAAFVTCIVAILLGSEATAMTIGGTTVVGLVAAFVTGRIIESKSERNVK